MRMQTLARSGLDDADSQAAEITCSKKKRKAAEITGRSVPDLPEDIWCHIHSLMPLCDAARAACLSCAFLLSWRCRPNLTLDWATLCSNGRGGNLSTKIDSILRNHSGIGLKILRLCLLDEYNFRYISSWLKVAVTPGIEELQLSLYKKYNFPCSILSDGVRNSIQSLQLDSCTFRPTAELGPLRSLTRLGLRSVRITGDELECLLSNSCSLEHLDLYDCNKIRGLKIPCVLRQLSSLTVISCSRLRVIENKAPNLSNLDFSGNVVGETLQMKKLSTGCSKGGICYARAKLPSIMPNLAVLDASSDYEVVNTPMLPSKFLYLKDLSIRISGATESPSYDCFSLISFLDASPSLQTLFLDVSMEAMEPEPVCFRGSSHLRQLPEHCRYDRLKSVKIVRFSCAKGLVELTCCIVKGAVSLEHLTLDTLRVNYRCSERNSSSSWGPYCWPLTKDELDKAAKAARAIGTYIECIVPATAKLTVLGPCTRCHSIPMDGYGVYKVWQTLRERETCQKSS